jgi:hypothetical protein
MQEARDQSWNDEDYSWLVGCPASDLNFKGALERSDRNTIAAAISHFEELGGGKTVLAALRRQMRKLEDGQADQTNKASDAQVVATAERQIKTTGIELATLQADRETERQLVELQNEKELAIADAYETAGIIKGLNFVGKVVTVTRLVRLDLVKKSKGYRGIGTWADYCNHVGLDRHTIDQQLLNLHTFGAEFLETVTSFGVGYREMRKLRQLASDGSIVIDAECITIGEETIPINEDHAEDLQIAIERVLEDRTKLNARVERLEKNLDEVVKEETKGLKAEVKALVKEVKRLRPYDPEEKDLSFATEQLQGIKEATLSTVALISSFIVDERVQQEPVIMGQVEGHMQTIELALSDLRRRWETVANLFEA